MSVHPRGRICLLSQFEFERLSEGIQPDCREHRHVGKVEAFEISRDPRYGRLLALIAAPKSSPEKPDISGCFIEIGGIVEYCHLRRTTKPDLEAIYALGEKFAADEQKPFRRRKFYTVPER